MVAVAFAAVSKEYVTGEPALHRLSLDIDDGTICCLIGPSGCGKSTALRLLAGLEQPDHGDIRLDRRIVTDRPTRDRGLGMVTQDVTLLPKTATGTSIGLPLDLRDTEPEERDRRVATQAAALEILELLDRRPTQLSGGEAQIAQIARAMVAQPSVLLLDEPLARIDHARRAAVRADLVRLQAAAGVTTLWVTADQTDAMAVADRIAVLLQGRLAQVGAPMDVYRRPRTLDVARFVGDPEIGLVAGTVRGVPGDRWLEIGDARCRLRTPLTGRPTDRDVVVGIRPHELIQVDEPHGPDAVAVEATVTGTEALGHAATAELVLAGTEDDMPSEGRRPWRLRWDRAPVATRVGDRVTLVVDPATIHLFDPHTGRALLHPDDGGAGSP